MNGKEQSAAGRERKPCGRRRAAEVHGAEGRRARVQRAFRRHCILEMTFAANMAEHRCTCYMRSLEISRKKKKKNADIKLVKNLRL